MAANAAASLLEIERDRLQGALKHLERSVVELKQALAEEGPDQDYKDAINENIVVMAKYRARIAALEDEIKRAKAGNMAELATLLTDPDASMQEDSQQQLQQYASLTPPAHLEPQAQQGQQQQQEPTAAAAAAGAAPALGAAAGSSIGSSQQAGQQEAASDGMWL